LIGLNHRIENLDDIRMIETAGDAQFGLEQLAQEIANRVQKGMLEPVPVKGRGEPVPMERPAQAAQEPEEKPAGVQDEPRGRRRG